VTDFIMRFFSYLEAEIIVLMTDVLNDNASLTLQRAPCLFILPANAIHFHSLVNRWTWTICSLESGAVAISTDALDQGTVYCDDGTAHPYHAAASKIDILLCGFLKN